MTSDHSRTVCMLLQVIAHQELLKGGAGIGHNLRGRAAANFSEGVEQPITMQRREEIFWSLGRVLHLVAIYHLFVVGYCHRGSL